MHAQSHTGVKDRPTGGLDDTNRRVEFGREGGGERERQEEKKGGNVDFHDGGKVRICVSTLVGHDFLHFFFASLVRSRKKR